MIDIRDKYERTFESEEEYIKFMYSINKGIILIDDLSPDTFRVCEGYDLDKKGNCKVNKQCITTDHRQTSKFVRCSNCFEFVEVPEGFKRFIEAKNILSADPAGLKKLVEAFELEI